MAKVQVLSFRHQCRHISSSYWRHQENQEATAWGHQQHAPGPRMQTRPEAPRSNGTPNSMRTANTKEIKGANFEPRSCATRLRFAAADDCQPQASYSNLLGPTFLAFSNGYQWRTFASEHRCSRRADVLLWTGFLNRSSPGKFRPCNASINPL